MMYETFYGLKEKPFSLLPDPAYLYLSEKHQLASTLLEYAVTDQAGFSVITGEIGAGKTTLIRHLLDHMDRNTTVGLISNTHSSLGGLLRWVVLAFDLQVETDNLPKMYQRFVDYLIAQYAKGRRTVLIVDEAQNLSVETLEELRMLSNVNADKDQVLQTILVGQPGLRSTLRRPELAQFAQRIVVDFHLDPLDAHETHAYIRHRLQVAGGNPEIFSDEACSAVHRYSRGSPRLINLICDMSLVYGFAEQSATIAESLVSDVVRDRQRLGSLPILADLPDPPAAAARHPVAPISLASANVMRAGSAAGQSPPTPADETHVDREGHGEPTAPPRPSRVTAPEDSPAAGVPDDDVRAAAPAPAAEPAVAVDVVEPDIVRLGASIAAPPPASTPRHMTVVPQAPPAPSRRFHGLSIGVGFAAGLALSVGAAVAVLLGGIRGGEADSERVATSAAMPIALTPSSLPTTATGNEGSDGSATLPDAAPADGAAGSATAVGTNEAMTKARERELQASLAASKAEAERLRAEAALAAARAETERLRSEASRATSRIEAERVRAEAALAAAQAEAERLRTQAVTPATPAVPVQNEAPAPAPAPAVARTPAPARETAAASEAKPVFQSNPCKGVSARFLSTCND